jgi:predicted phosphohydrolase
MTVAEKVEQTSEEAIFERELIRLKLSLEQMDPQAACRIAMTHYPPIGADLAPSKASALLAQYHVNMCVFGHLHSIQKGLSLFGSADGIQYRLVAADYVDFCPVKIYET